MLKPLVPKFHADLSVRSKDIAEKQVSTKLKPIVAASYVTERTTSLKNRSEALLWRHSSVT